MGQSIGVLDQVVKVTPQVKRVKCIHFVDGLDR